MAAAQSPELLEATRIHDPKATERTKAELERCLAAKCPAADRLSLLLGFLKLSQGDAAGAAAQLSSRPSPSGLEAFHGWYLGEAQAYAGSPTKARTTLARALKSAPPWLAHKLELRIAELDLGLGRAAKALPVLEAAAALKPSPELLLDRALARWAFGDVARARSDFRLIAIKYPGHPHASIAVRFLEAGGLQWSDEEQLQRAQGQLSQGDAGGCLTTLGLVHDERLGQRVALLTGQALLARGREADGFAQLDQAVKGTSRAVSVEALLTMGRRLVRQGDNAGAQRVFGQLDDAFPTQPGSDEGAYLAAWLMMNGGELEAATTAFEAFEQRHPESRKRDEARWFRGFTLVKRGVWEEARTVLKSLGPDFPRSALMPQAAYWATRAAQLGLERRAIDGGTDALDAGPSVDVASEYRELLEAFSGSIYARLALERLRELGVEAAEPFRVKPVERTAKAPPRLALSAELTRAGLFADAQEEVEAAVATVGTPDEALVFGHALQTMGHFAAAHALAARYLWGPVYTQRAPGAVGLMYPRAWRPTVEQWASAHGVDPFFAWAIMRRESGFRPDVTSSADARGLMQLIPPTARQIAIELKASPVDPDELYSPEVNVKLGTWYLSQLFHRLTHPGLVAAAYNGGPAPVVKWVQRRPDLPFDQWLEEIPYKETRGYVKQVVADFFIYQALYGETVERLPLTLPSPKANGVSF